MSTNDNQRPDPAFPFTVHVSAGTVDPFTGQRAPLDKDGVFTGLSADAYLVAHVKSLDTSNPAWRGAIRKVVRREMAAQFLAAQISYGRVVIDAKSAVSWADELLKELGE